jgi:type I restriction enzyme S subunit
VLYFLVLISIPTASCHEPKIPLAPKSEQKAIVSKLDKLLNNLNHNPINKNKVPSILARFRQSILSSAYSGRLTTDWRKKNSSATRKSNSQNRAETTDLPEIPESWSWVTLPETGEMSRGKSKHRPRNAPHLFNGEYPFIQTGDISQSNGLITQHRQTYNKTGLAQSRLWPAQTVCITIAANIAESAILTYPACFPDSIVGIIADRSKCLPEFLEYFIRTAKNDLATFAPATAQKNINIKILNEVHVPLPPIDEQHEIVDRIKVLFNIADEIEARHKFSRLRISKLRQSILSKAFSGELR